MEGARPDPVNITVLRWRQTFDRARSSPSRPRTTMTGSPPIVAVKDWLGSEPDAVADYRSIIDRDDVDIVHIVTPDHWHAKVAIEAMLSGKDVYCEKPMTLTIEEGRQICDVCRRTGRVFQVGTQQRSIRQMIKAVALIRAGRLGELKRVQVLPLGSGSNVRLCVGLRRRHPVHQPADHRGIQRRRAGTG